MIFMFIMLGYIVISSIIVGIMNSYGFDDTTIVMYGVLWPIAILICIVAFIVYGIASLVEIIINNIDTRSIE